MAAAEGTAFMLPFVFAARRLKPDIARVGTLDNGLSVYRYRYQGEGVTRIGLMADDVAARDPDAVREFAGYLAVDYDRATRAM